jgi:hypothetical protein
MLYTCRVTEVIDRLVLVEADGETDAKVTAENKRAWLDLDTPISTNVYVEYVRPTHDHHPSTD